MSKREIELAEFIAEEFNLEVIKLAILMKEKGQENARLSLSSISAMAKR